MPFPHLQRVPPAGTVRRMHFHCQERFVVAHGKMMKMHSGLQEVAEEEASRIPPSPAPHFHLQEISSPEAEKETFSREEAW